MADQSDHVCRCLPLQLSARWVALAATIRPNLGLRGLPRSRMLRGSEMTVTTALTAFLVVGSTCAALGCGESDSASGTPGMGGSSGSGAAGAGGGAGTAGAGVDAGAQTDPELKEPTFVKTWGKQGTQPGEFVEPSSVELDAAGNVYVSGHEDRLQKFTFDGQQLDIFGTSGTGDLQFNHPHGLAMDRAEGLLYAGDQNNGRVQVLTTDGKFVRLWSDPQFKHIHDVGIDPLTGDIFVGDFELDIMQKFTNTGVKLLQFGGSGSGDGQFAGAWGISTDSKARVYVGDTGNKRVQIFASDGTYLSQWTGFNKPTGVFVDAKDRIYVCDSLADEVVILNTEGKRLATWNLTAIIGSKSEPEDIIISADGIHLYLGDVLNHRIIYLKRAGI